MQTENIKAVTQHNRDNINTPPIFDVLKEDKPQNEKLKQVVKYLNEGADINAIDVPTGNTLLHIAATKGEVLVVKFLLDRRANVAIKNNENHTTLDISQFPATPNRTKLSAILETHCKRCQTDKYGQHTSVRSPKVKHQTAKSQQEHVPKEEIVKNEINITYEYQKRSGTSGLSGQLYETKLLALILLRALSDDRITEFLLGTNIEGVGAFDDVVFRYKTEDSQKSKLIFLQAKHRDDPTKDKLNVEEIMKQNGDYSLLKYFESYSKTKQKFETNNSNAMFQGSMKEIECLFIIYTCAKENFTKKQMSEYSDEEKFIRTSSDGKVFQFKYDNKDIDDLISAVTKSRAIQLAKTLWKFCVKGNFNNIMMDDLIKTFHVFLSRNVVELQNSVINSKSDSPYRIGKFFTSFLTSSEEILLHMRGVFCREMAELKSSIPSDQQSELTLESLSFKLPEEFGNLSFSFSGSIKVQQRRLKYICSIFDKLLENVCSQDSKYVVVELDDDSVGEDKVIQNKDLKNFRLGGLVGNLLVHDHETDMLKFNSDEQTLSEDNIKIFEYLKEKYELSTFRFDINIYTFPRLTLSCKRHDQQLLTEFLSNVKFYTDQGKEDEVEKIIKGDIYKQSKVHQKQSDPLFRVKCDAIYLKIHDQIQKWWKQPNLSPYLSKNCNYYHQAKLEILDSSFLNIIHFTYNEKLKHILIEFNADTINSLRIDWFLNSDENVLIVVSNDIYFTSVKFIQYFTEIKKEKDYIFIDFDLMIIENCLEIVKSELESLLAPILIIVSRGNQDIYQNVAEFIKLFKGKIILIAPQSHENDLTFENSQYIIQKDNKNNFMHLSDKVRKMILDERKVNFQGEEFTVNTVLDNASLNLLSSNLLLKIIRNENITIGATLNYNIYNDTINYYVNQSVCRYITLNHDRYLKPDSNNDNEDQMSFITSGAQDKIDIVLITEYEKRYEEVCQTNEESNIHWFVNKDNQLIWRKSRGSLKNLTIYKDRGTHKDHTFQLKTLKDVQEKVVIISAEPGMGKSTLLTYVAINTKRLNPSLWVLKINLHDHIDIFYEWKELKKDINLTEVMIFLQGIIDIKDNNGHKYNISKLLATTNDNEIYLNDLGNKNLLEIDLSEVKLFNYFYNNNRLAILFDGFDEICPDYANEVIQLLCILKHSKLAHLWVTSRTYNVLDQLELALGTFSFGINPLTVPEQMRLFQNSVSHRLGLDKYMQYRFFNDPIAVVLGTMDVEFSSVPLHIYMLAELYHDFLKSSFITPNTENSNTSIFININLITLYDEFTKIKFNKIRFGEKKQSANFKDPDMRKMMEKERKLFVDNHKKIAAYSLFDRDIVLCEDDTEDVMEFIETIKSGDEKTGIVQYIIGDNPKFIHFTFAEYFAVEFLIDKLRSKKCTSSLWQYFIYDILSKGAHGIRRFINSKLERDLNIVNELLSNKNHMNTVFDVLTHCNSKLSNTAIYVAVIEDLQYITTFLLQCCKTILNKSNLQDFIKIINAQCREYEYCVFCTTLARREELLVEYILELIADIDSKRFKDLFTCEDLHKFGPLLHALYNGRMTRITLDYLQGVPDVMVDIFTMPHTPENKYTAAHYMGTNGYSMVHCWDYLMQLNKEQRIKIFSVKDGEGQLPLHNAAKENDYNFFASIDKLLGRDEFKKMCTTVDNSGWSPICRLPYNKNYLVPLKNILEIVFEETDIDVIDFLLYKLPNLFPKKHIRI